MSFRKRNYGSRIDYCGKLYFTSVWSSLDNIFHKALERGSIYTGRNPYTRTTKSRKSCGQRSLPFTILVLNYFGRADSGYYDSLAYTNVFPPSNRSNHFLKKKEIWEFNNNSNCLLFLFGFIAFTYRKTQNLLSWIQVIVDVLEYFETHNIILTLLWKVYAVVWIIYFWFENWMDCYFCDNKIRTKTIEKIILVINHLRITRLRVASKSDSNHFLSNLLWWWKKHTKV